MNEYDRYSVRQLESMITDIDSILKILNPIQFERDKMQLALSRKLHDQMRKENESYESIRE